MRTVAIKSSQTWTGRCPRSPCRRPGRAVPPWSGSRGSPPGSPWPPWTSSRPGTPNHGTISTPVYVGTLSTPDLGHLVDVHPVSACHKEVWPPAEVPRPHPPGHVTISTPVCITIPAPAPPDLLRGRGWVEQRGVGGGELRVCEELAAAQQLGLHSTARGYQLPGAGAGAAPSAGGNSGHTAHPGAHRGQACCGPQ